jgi:hypothetical protein
MSDFNLEKFKATVPSAIKDILVNSALSDYYSNFSDTAPDLNGIKFRKAYIKPSQYVIVNSLDGLEKLVALVTVAPNLLVRLTWSRSVSFRGSYGTCEAIFQDSYSLDLELENTAPLSKLFFIADKFRMVYMTRKPSDNIHSHIADLHTNVNTYAVEYAQNISKFALELSNLVKPHLPK